jgi:hypothetical protein
MLYNVCGLEKQELILEDYRIACARHILHECLLELGLIQVLVDVLLKCLLLSHTLLANFTCQIIQGA